MRTVANPIANQYIVVLRVSAALMANEAATSEEANVPTVDALADEMVKSHGASLLRIYSHVLRGFAIKADDLALARFLNDSRVAYVQQSGVVTGSATQTNAPWGLDRSDQRSLPLNTTYTYGSNASNVHAYVLDSGLNAQHQEFTGRVGNGFGAINDGFGTADCHGHGTHVSGILGGTTWGIAKGVLIHPVRVLDCLNNGTDMGVLDGIEWIAANHVKPAVANMSFETGGPLPSVDTAVGDLINAGVTVVVAAGNMNKNACNFSPARVAAAITVGATESNDRRWSSSNTGSCLDLFAPGHLIPSSWINGASSTNTISGTSMASPHVAGAAALHLSIAPTSTPTQVATAVINNATVGKVTSAGSNSPNRLLYVANTAPPNIPFRKELSGAWYNPNTSGQGHLIEIDPQINLIFAGWYTFDVNGQQGGSAQQQRWYTAIANYSAGDTSKVLTVYRNNGGNFDAPPTTQAQEIGTATLSFQSCTTGKLDYQVTVDGQARNGSIPLTRIGSAQYCSAGSTPAFSLSQSGINPSLNGAWYEAATSGQGFQFYFSPQDNNLAFISWYTYDVNGQSGSGPSGQRWYTVQGSYTPGNTSAANVPIYATTGGRFDVGPPVMPGPPIGTATLSFSSCDAATLTYAIPGRPNGTIPLTRITGGSNCMP